MENFTAEWEKAGVIFTRWEPLAKHSSIRIGGVARFGVFPADEKELILCLQTLKNADFRYTVVGNGSNLVFPDGCFDGAVIFTGFLQTLSKKGSFFTVSAGTPLSRIAKEAMRNSLSGMEFAAGIPGTLGGALVTNAGAFGGSMKDVTVSSVCYDTKTDAKLVLFGSEQKFSYRKSFYAEHPDLVILFATLQFSPEKPEVIRERIEAFQSYRKQTQPLCLPNAGSVFKHPSCDASAGELIERCGWKGKGEGDVFVSEKHAGFFVNRGRGSCRDVKKLIEKIKEDVYIKTGVLLEEEIRFLPE